MLSGNATRQPAPFSCCQCYAANARRDTCRGMALLAGHQPARCCYMHVTADTAHCVSSRRHGVMRSEVHAAARCTFTRAVLLVRAFAVVSCSPPLYAVSHDDAANRVGVGGMHQPPFLSAPAESREPLLLSSSRPPAACRVRPSMRQEALSFLQRVRAHSLQAT